MRRLLVVLALVMLPLLSAVPAHATFTSNDIGCAGSADIVDRAKTYHVNADHSTAKVPRQGEVHYDASVQTITHNHHGQVSLHVLGSSISVETWGPSANASDKNQKSGVRDLPSALKNVPPGKYVVEGFHKGDEGECSGQITIDLQGSAFSSPFVLASFAGTIVGAVLLVLAGFAKAAVK